MEIDDMDVFDSVRALLDQGIDLDNQEAVERVLVNPYRGGSRHKPSLRRAVHQSGQGQPCGRWAPAPRPRGDRVSFPERRLI
jgi:hypothetical protein